MRKKNYKVGEANKIKEASCFACGHKMDRTSCVGEVIEKPKPGSITICIKCGHVMAFDDDIALRELTEFEAIGVAGHPIILAVQKARGYVMKKQEKGEK